MRLGAKNIERWAKGDDFFIGFGGLFRRKNIAQFSPITVPYEVGKGHWSILGATRSGKTVLLRLLLRQIIRKGYGLLLIDMKPDLDLFNIALNETIRCGREEDFTFFSPFFSSLRSTIEVGDLPATSASTNPLIFGSQSEIVSRILNAFRGGGRQGEQFWEDVKEDIVDALVGSLMGLGRFNFRDLYITLTNDEAREWVIKHTKNEESAVRLKALHDFLTTSPQKAQVIVRGTQVALGRFAFGDHSPYLNSYDPTFYLSDAVREGRIVYVALSYQKSAVLSSAVARMLISELNSVIGDVLVREGKLEKKFFAVIDEFANCVFPGVEDLFNKSAGAGLTLIVAHQSLSDVVHRAGESMLKIYLDNTHVKIFLLQTGADAGKFVEEMSPLTWGEDRRTWEFSITNLLVPFELNRSETLVPEIKKEYLTGLHPLNFYAKVGERWYRGVVPILIERRKEKDLDLRYPPPDLESGLNLMGKYGAKGSA